MLFTFGKYAGYDLCEIESSYLCYALDNFTSLPEPLRLRCRAELVRRYAVEQHTPTVAAESVDLRVRIKETYRRLSMIHHPDRGGSTSGMQAINEFYEALSL